MLRVAIITGSTRPGRHNDAVARWVYGLAHARQDAAFEFVDIADYHLPLLDEPLSPMLGQYTHAHTKAWAQTGRIGKKGVVYATCFRDSRDVWGVSRSWASADR